MAMFFSLSTDFYVLSDIKFSSNLNEIDRSEQKPTIDKKMSWATEDSTFNKAGEYWSCLRDYLIGRCHVLSFSTS